MLRIISILSILWFLTLFFSGLPDTAQAARFLKVGDSSGGTDEQIMTDITVEGDVVLKNIAGAAFTLEFSPDMTLTSVTSNFFDTFFFNDQVSGKAIISAARAAETPASQSAGNVLFTLAFRLKTGASPGTYDIKIRPTTLKSTNNGYSPGGETVDILLGSDLSQPGTSAGAFPVLINDDVDASGYSAHAAEGSVRFGGSSNAAPVAASQSVSTAAGTPLKITLNATDTDGDTLTYAIATQPAHGTLSGTPPGVTYTSNTAYSGSDTFTFKASDGQLNSNVATVTVNVTALPSNKAPTADNINVSADAGKPVNITLTASDPEGDSLKYLVVSQPSHGTLTGTAPTLSYTSATDFNGVDQFTFKANDGKSDSSIGTVSVTVTRWPTTTPKVRLMIEDAQASPGDKSIPVSISLDNTTQDKTPVNSMQFRVRYNAAEGIHAKDTFNFTSRTASFEAFTKVKENGANSEVFVLIYSMGGLISAGTGPIFELMFDVDESVIVDASSLSFSECLVSDGQANAVPSDFSDTALFNILAPCKNLGDINRDDFVNTLDLQLMINCILGISGCHCSDLNQDGDYNIYDFVALINKIRTAARFSPDAELRADGVNIFTLPNILVQPNETGSFFLSLKNDKLLSVAMNLAFRYNAGIGFRITNVETTSRTAAFSPQMNTVDIGLSEKEVRVFLYKDKATISPGDGEFLKFTYQTENNTTGRVAFNFTKAYLTDYNNEAVPSVRQIDYSQTTRMEDAVMALRILAGDAETEIAYKDALDLNWNGIIDIADVIYILRIMTGLDF